jgi:YesN/AraC family two-component response regulator
MTLVWMLEFVQIFLIDVAGKPENVFYKYIYLAISLIMFLIVYRSLNQPQIFSEVNFNEAEEINEPKNEVEESGYYKSGLTEQKINEIASSLLIIMQNDKPYLKSNLSLSDLAQLNGVSAHNLSEVINTKLNKTFYDFINQYRVDEVKKMLNDVKYENYSILSIGFEAGFNSKDIIQHNI